MVFRLLVLCWLSLVGTMVQAQPASRDQNSNLGHLRTVGEPQEAWTVGAIRWPHGPFESLNGQGIETIDPSGGLAQTIVVPTSASDSQVWIFGRDPKDVRRKLERWGEWSKEWKQASSEKSQLGMLRLVWLVEDKPQVDEQGLDEELSKIRRRLLSQEIGWSSAKKVAQWICRPTQDKSNEAVKLSGVVWIGDEQWDAKLSMQCQPVSDSAWLGNMHWETQPRIRKSSERAQPMDLEVRLVAGRTALLLTRELGGKRSALAVTMIPPAQLE